MKRYLYALTLIIATCSASSASPEKITAAKAKNNVGKRMTVCGVVASANYAVRSRSRPTFLYLDEPYPRHIFTAMIRGEDRAKFGAPETLKGRRICVSGLIESYLGKPQIVLRETEQLRPE